MPRDKDFKRHVRRRMDRTAERYTEARERLRGPDSIEWRIVGDQAAAYEHSVSEEPGAPGRRVHVLRCAGDPGDGFGGLSGVLAAAGHRGRRVRFSVALRAEDVDGWAGVWLRADGPGDEVLSFGSTQDQPVTGTTGWLPLAVVVDVPPEAERVVVGAILRGRGAVRLAGAQVEPVPDTVPLSFPSGPSGWILDGTGRDAYELVEEADQTPAGPARVAVLRSVASPGTSFASMSRTGPAARHRGTRLRLSAALRGDALDGMAGLWMRIDGGRPRRQLAFDNMLDRPLRGAFDWTRASVVLDVPEEADVIAYGVLLAGRGAVRAADVRLEPVGDGVAVTGTGSPVGLGPRGWTLTGSRPDAYELRFEADRLVEGRRAAVLRSVADPGDGFGTAAHWFHVSETPPQRIRLRAALRGEDLGPDSGAVLWLRLDAAGGEQLALVNEPDPPLRGTFGWRSLEALLDVPASTAAVGLGVVLAGTGSVWMAEVALEAAGPAGGWAPLPGAPALDVGD